MVEKIDTEELEACLPALSRFAHSLTRNPDAASDLVQDCVERALRKAHLFDGANLNGWLFTMCRRIFLNQLRQKKKFQHSQASLDDVGPAVAATAHTQEIHVYCSEVANAFMDLSGSDRRILSMAVIGGLKYTEISNALDIPLGTVRSRLSRARSKLARSLGAEDAPQAATDPLTRPHTLEVYTS